MKGPVLFFKLNYNNQDIGLLLLNYRMPPAPIPYYAALMKASRNPLLDRPVNCFKLF
jgi:hypothetical protein